MPKCMGRTDGFNAAACGVIARSQLWDGTGGTVSACKNGAMGLLIQKKVQKAVPNQRCREHYEKTWTTQKSGPVVVAML